MDPQSRILHEEVLRTLWHVAQGNERFIKQQTAVCVGCMYQEYVNICTSYGGEISAALSLGNSLSFLVGRQKSTLSICDLFFVPKHFIIYVLKRFKRHQLKIFLMQVVIHVRIYWTMHLHRHGLFIVTCSHTSCTSHVVAQRS